MIEMTIIGVRVELPSNQPVVLLKETKGNRYLPIWIGNLEAGSIAFAQQEVVSPRPLTHDLFYETLQLLNHTITGVHVVDVEDSIFRATVTFDNDRDISARASDAITLALLAKLPLMCSEHVVDSYAVSLDMESQEDGESEVEKFREFLDHIAPDDFEDN